MNNGLERARAASRAYDLQLEEDREHRELQEAIRLSNMDDTSTQSGSPTPSPERAEEDQDLQEAIRLSKMDNDSTTSGSSTPDPEVLEESHHLEEAIRLSKMPASPTASDSHSPFSAQHMTSKAGFKRKAEEELGPQSMKRAQGASADVNASYGSGYRSFETSEHDASSLAASSKAEATMTYPNGALRITRTPGRLHAKNCINLKDVVQGKSLVSACAFSFFIGEEEFYRHFPLSHSSNKVPIYIGRDVNMDPITPQACRQASVFLVAGEGGKAAKIAKKTMATIEPKLRDLYSKRYGINYHTFYAWSSGSSHSKILVLVYPSFLRVVITSCNMMDIDTVLGDNHWYIHDLPKLASRSKLTPSSFETELLSHLSALNTPEAFIESIQGMYDYSKVKVHLTTSVPGVCSGAKAEKHGLLRLRRIVQDLNFQLDKKQTADMRLEICAASIGGLTGKWLNNFGDCALGKSTFTAGDQKQAIPDVKLFYPTVGDVKNADQMSQDAASNIGCHLRPWSDVPSAIKRIFHHYQSNDTGKLFHQKLILAYNPRDQNVAPYYVYIGSANFSQSAWGGLEADKKKNNATSDTKLVKIANFECGVVIPGDLVESLLEPGTQNWQTGIVPYDQNAAQYNLQRGDKPWNDPRWVVNFDENY